MKPGKVLRLSFMRNSRLILLFAFAFALAACKGDRALPAASAGTPIIIISIDTLRSDRLPVYGYDGVQTPNIDAFRGDAVLYERAYAHTPLTLPSHTSMLTGTLPAVHGIRDNTGYRLAKEVRPITEILREHGYVTGAAVSSYVLRRETGFDRGFDFFDDSVDPLNPRMRTIVSMQRDGAATAKVAGEWLGKQTKPVFFLLHLYEPHMPHSAPEPYKSRYPNGYDAEIARTDEIVGDFLATLRSSGLYDKSLIILLSDHGEGLNDHGEEDHGTFLYREAIQVPLLIKFPGGKFKGSSVEAPVQIIDVVPTLFERTGIKPPGALPGRSLATTLVEPKAEWRRVYSESFYPRIHYGWSDQHSLIDGRHHYIHSTRPELFDLEQDFAEKTDVRQQDRRTYFAMKTAIEPLIKEAAAPAAVDSEEAAKLAALGYLGSTVQTKPGEVLPDPKDHIAELAESGAAFALFSERRYDEVLAKVNALLARNPRLLDMWDLKSKALTRKGRLAEAVAASKEGLKIAPQASFLAMDVAKLQMELGNLDDAEKHAELAIGIDAVRAHDLLARIAIARGQFARAETEVRKALSMNDDKISPFLTMAILEREKGNIDEALRHLDQAVAKKKDEVETLHFLRGDILARLGRAEEAEREFRAEIQFFPENQPAYKNLTLLLVAGGRIPEATAVIRQLIQEAPIPDSYHTVCDVLMTVGDVRGVRYWARQGLARFPNDPTLRRLAS